MTAFPNISIGEGHNRSVLIPVSYPRSPAGCGASKPGVRFRPLSAVVNPVCAVPRSLKADYGGEARGNVSYNP